MANKKKQQFGDWVKCLVMLLGGIVYFLIILAVLNKGLDFCHVGILVLFIITLILYFKNSKQIINFYHKHTKMMKIIMIILIGFGFLMRFSLLMMQDKLITMEKLSDTGVHWYGAQQIVEDGQFDQEIGDYERLFPYLSSYTGSLAISMSIFGENYSAVLFLNIFFDVIACIAIYYLFCVWKGDNRIALVAATFWGVNPLQIIFCGLPLAIVVVNMCVVLSILSVCLLFKGKEKITKTFAFSLLSGALFALGNAFRPIFIIFVLATIVCWAMVVLNDKKELKVAVCSCLVLVLSYGIVGLLPSIAHTQFNPYYSGEKARPGWGIYIGANYETSGRWSSNDSNNFFGPILSEQADNDIEEAQSIVMAVAMNRYVNIIGQGKLLQHFFNKTTTLFGDVKNSIYDFSRIFDIKKSNQLYLIIQDAILVFYYGILMMIFYEIFLILKKKKFKFKDDTINYLVVLLVGLFMAFLLVESMNRYSLPFVAILLIIALGFADREKQLDVI